MASYGLYQKSERVECSNCGVTDSLALCSRCHSAWFCSVKCQKAYWPFHKAWCHKNDFADAVEREEPKFARWMRKHAKLAVLKDDEVDRLERKTTTMDDMYGRANPKPLPPSYDSDDIRRMRAADQLLIDAKRSNSKQELIWKEVVVPKLLGLSLRDDTIKWRQTQANVEVFVRLPSGATAQEVQVTLRPSRLEVTVRGEKLLFGDLSQPVKCDESTWLICDGVLEVILLKKNRRGQYDNGKSNADTFWFSLLKAGAEMPDEAPAAALEDASASELEAEDGDAAADAAACASGSALVALPGAERIPTRFPPAAYFRTAHDGPVARAAKKQQQQISKQQITTSGGDLATLTPLALESAPAVVAVVAPQQPAAAAAAEM